MLKPSQCRAGRALLGWSQDDLEARSQVSKKTIAEFEREAQIPYGQTLREIELALEAGGVQIISENGGGAGVRLKAAVPHQTRKRASRFDRMAALAVSYRGREYQVQLPTEILDDIDRTSHRTDAALEKSMDDHMNLILLAAAAAIDDRNRNRVDPNGIVMLTNDDFIEETGPRRRTLARFEVGQKFMGKNTQAYIAEVIQVADEGRKAWVDLRTPDGTLWDSAWVVYAQFSQNWRLT